jgi:FMN-dependent NADH-azoreductase
VTVIRAEGVNIGPEARQAAFDKARLSIGELQPATLAA